MKIKIIKGADEIGGSCVELSSERTTILLDYGTPLKQDGKQVVIDKKLDGVLISHPHQDHYGEIEMIDPSVPIYCGELSRELMNATRLFTGRQILANQFVFFKPWEKFTVGDLTITPYLVDHSAVDAYAFLIEAEGKKVLYSGDFRSNGRKSKLFEQMIHDEHLKNIDVLLMEGTMLQRNNEQFPDEQSVEDEIYRTMTESEIITFLISSSQNIDTLVSAYRACKRAKKIFVVDIYTAWILEKLQIVSDSVPNMQWEGVQVITKFGGSYYEKIKNNANYFKGFKSELFNHVVDVETIKNAPSKYFIKVSPWYVSKILEMLKLNEANVLYSQWLGYLTEEFSDERTVALYQELKNKYTWRYAHTGGHADLNALKIFAGALNPKKLIPIHTEYKDEFLEHFANVIVLEDGEVHDVGR